ncbi:hypothetical protein AgCh_026509 [Apium graveolens]
MFNYQNKEKETIRNILDLYQCLAVCRSWRFVAKQVWQTRVLSTTPWLLFHVDASEKIFVKTNLNKCLVTANNNNDDSEHGWIAQVVKSLSSVVTGRNLNLFRLETYASYDGWLLLGNSRNPPVLYNPITSHLLQLPRLPRGCLLDLNVKFVSSGDSPADDKCIICIKLSKSINFCNAKAYDNHNTILAFCRPSVSTSWIVLREKEKVEDVIFNGGKFYTIVSGGELFVYNSDIINGNTSFCDDQTWEEMKIAEAVFNTKSLLRSDDCWFYLVESTQRELLMIMRTIGRDNYFTKSFRVFKLNKRRNYCHQYYWKEISSLHKKESIILLRNEGMSILVNDQNGYKSNSIYFYEGHWGHSTTYGNYDLGSRKICQKTEDAACINAKLFTPSKVSKV